MSAETICAGNQEEAIALVEAMGFGSKAEIWAAESATLESERAA